MLYLGCMVVLRHDHDDKCCMAGHNLDMVLDTCTLYFTIMPQDGNVYIFFFHCMSVSIKGRQ